MMAVLIYNDWFRIQTTTYTLQMVFGGNWSAGIKFIREKSCGGRFLWNKNWDLGWIWAGSATFEAGFLMFSWAKKKFKNIVDSENIFCIEWS